MNRKGVMNGGKVLFASIVSAITIVVSGNEIPTSFKAKQKRGEWDCDKKSGERSSVTWKAFNESSPGLRCIGTLKVRKSSEISDSRWSVGCETLDRDYADFSVFGHLVGEVGVKRARLFSGWAKTEQTKGVYDFTWLDAQIDGLLAQGVKPWLCLSYGNPVYGGDFRLGMKIKQLIGNPVAFAAWRKYVAEVVGRYGDRIDEWEIWNEPFNQGPDYAVLIVETGRLVRRLQPGAKLIVSGIKYPEDYTAVCEKLKLEGELGLIDTFIYHPYQKNPDEAEVLNVASAAAADGWCPPGRAVRELVQSYNSGFKVMQGEAGCPAQLEFEHAMHSYPWTEYSQAKWNARHAIICAAMDMRYNFFTFIDLQYPFMLQSFGMIRSNTMGEIIYRRPFFYTARNICSIFDGSIRSGGFASNVCETVVWADANECGKQRTALAARFAAADGSDIVAAWYADRIPGDSLSWDRVNLSVAGVAFSDPVFLDIVTGKVYEIPADTMSTTDVAGAVRMTRFANLPFRDSPIVIADRSQIPIR